MFGDPIPNVDIYDPSTDRWYRGADMPRPRSDFGCVTGPDGRIYVFGGYAEEGGGDDYSQSGDVYDPTTDSWSAISDMNVVRYAVAGSIGADGRIYAIGGSVGAGAPTSAEAYDPSNDTWTFVASMNAGRSTLGAALGPDGRIYAIGGQDASILSSVEAYNP